MTTNTDILNVDIKLVGDNELSAALRSLDYATQQRALKAILRDAGNNTIVKALKAITPVRTGKLQKSMGVVSGRNRRRATVFVGPRMSHIQTARGREGYSGWVANILENAKDHDRVPLKAKSFKPFSGTGAGPEFFKKVGPIRKRIHFSYAIESNIKNAEVHIIKSTRKVIERTWNRKVKKWGLSDYARVKGRQ